MQAAQVVSVVICKSLAVLVPPAKEARCCLVVAMAQTAVVCVYDLVALWNYLGVPATVPRVAQCRCKVVLAKVVPAVPFL